MRDSISPDIVEENLVHIVPTVPPAFNGLADYNYKLWQHWPQPRPRWTCLAADIPQGAKEIWPEAHIVPFDLSKRGLLDGLEQAAPNCVILHYVGYAYNKRGLPLWLPAALREWKARSNGRLCVMFHELYATGSPRQSVFWLQPLTKGIVTQLVKISDVWVTSNEAAIKRLATTLGVAPQTGYLIPVGSNIEPSSPIDFSRPWPLAQGEKLRVAVFGLPHSRAKTLAAHSHLLKMMCDEDMVEAISLIGKRQEASATSRELQEQIVPADSGVWQVHADLSPSELSDVLARHDISFSRSSPDLLTKSGSYAAGCVHGLPTVCCPRNFGDLAPVDFGARQHLPVPYLANNDNNPGEALSKLRDFSYVENWRADIERAAKGSLDWAEIVAKWDGLVRG